MEKSGAGAIMQKLHLHRQTRPFNVNETLINTESTDILLTVVVPLNTNEGTAC